MTEKEILAYVSSHPSGKIKIAYVDIDGILRGKYISHDKFLSAYNQGTSFCDVIFGWDSGDVAYDNAAYTGWHSGYPDTPARIDLSTFRKIPWENDVPFFLGEIIDKQGAPPHVCPRQLVKKIADEASSMGFTTAFSQEFEWFNFAEVSATAHEKGFRNLQPMSNGMFGYSILRTTERNTFFTDLFSHLNGFGIPVEGLHTETGPGVLEAAIAHSDIVTAADRATLFKTAVKSIAFKNGLMATFMAKISESLPGCGGHVHQSLWDKQRKKNLFYEAKDPLGMSDIFRQYLAGQLLCMKEILPLFAPTINSYKRLVEGAWAPTTITWGIDNRTVALRVLGGEKSCRLETRVIGSDVNPHLAMAGALASGLYGIKKKLKLTQKETKGNGYKDDSAGRLPATLDEATRIMKNSKIAREILGDAFVDHFTQTREWEWRQHLKAVTDWELKRYFEII
jgi:glutamine synthetase